MVLFVSIIRYFHTGSNFNLELKNLNKKFDPKPSPPKQVAKYFLARFEENMSWATFNQVKAMKLDLNHQ